MKLTFNIKSTLKKLKKWVALIGILTCLGAIFGYLHAIKQKENTYQSKVQVLVQLNYHEGSTDSDYIEANIQMIDAYRELILSDTVLQNVSKRLEKEGVKLSAKQIEDKLSVEKIDKSQTFTITYTNTDEKLSYRVLELIMEDFEDTSKKLLDIKSIKTIKSGTIYKSLATKVIIKNMIVSTLTLFVFSVGLALMVIFCKENVEII